MNLANIYPDVPPIRVLIVDAMAILQGMKKNPGMTTIAHLKTAFLNKILRLSRGYDEIRIVFDHYLEDSLKSKTRASRATSKAAEKASYDVHDNMSYHINFTERPVFVIQHQKQSHGDIF